MRFEVNGDLVAQYNRPGPRYTSYPTAPHFTEDFGAIEFLSEIRQSNKQPDRVLSLYVHLPFCKSLCYYCGCHMMVTHRPEKIEQYVRYVEREVDLVAREIHPDRVVKQIHWGGGTPTFLSPGQIERLAATLNRRFTVAPDAEVSIEADPRNLSREHLEAARRGGFNRISFGVQDFDPKVQEAIGRIQPEELVWEAVETSRELGFESISIDLIYGLPYQTVASFDRTIDRVLALGPDRISLFSYAHVPWIKKHQILIPTAELPAPEDKLRIFTHTIARLTEDGGYRYVGMDHFAREDDSLCRAQDEGTLYRNFQGYSTHAGSDIYAFGISGISQLEWVYAQNVKDLPSYYRSINAGVLPTQRGVRLSPEDQLRRHVITRLMCDFALDRDQIEQRFGIDFDEHFADALPGLADLEENGLIEISDRKIRVTDVGRLFIRNVAMPFDAYLKQDKRTDTPTFSQTV